MRCREPLADRAAADADPRRATHAGRPAARLADVQFQDGGGGAGRPAATPDYEHDIVVLSREHRPDMDAIHAELAGHLSATDLAEVRAIVASIEKRIAESRRRFGGR